ncbi:hypothetical protein [Bradyrhizobium australiense]|uniref:Uncharacterized protein n=1 Tax=Bradyrhizobium australiense TaxID=2721161 RepID=A0A7Y4GNK2_9BRAD|nr:hypothetical protein [Bradyrhizobium australiense]NOJ39078.1 hypothetical protein [Bradyrhizobium australiense]
MDALVVLDGIIFHIEFKVGAEKYDASAVDQVMDYALDLKNFHAGSHSRRIDSSRAMSVTEATPEVADLDLAADQVIAACGGEPREAVKSLLVANDFLERQLDELRAKVSAG